MYIKLICDIQDIIGFLVALTQRVPLLSLILECMAELIWLLHSTTATDTYSRFYSIVTLVELLDILKLSAAVRMCRCRLEGTMTLCVV